MTDTSLAAQRIAFILVAGAGTWPSPRAALAQAPPPASLPRAEVFHVVASEGGLRVLLRHQPPPPSRGSRRMNPVLFVHGATFPSALAAAYRFRDGSWMEDLALRGHDVWAFDFLGYGGSDRYPEMGQPAELHGPLGRAPEAARQIGAAVEFIRRRQGVERVSLVAHSWGTIPAGLFSGDHPDRVDRLVLFGPVAQRTGAAEESTADAYWFVTEKAQRDRFNGYVPPGEPPVFAPTDLARWGPAYLATDPMSSTRDPGSVKVPSGPIADANDAWAGHLAYDPARITAPVLIVRGAWDIVTEDADAAWLFTALRGAPMVRDVKLSRGTHVMHLETGRHQLYDEVALFLSPPPRRTGP